MIFFIRQFKLRGEMVDVLDAFKKRKRGKRELFKYLEKR
jgi:hypothetical protein